MYLMISFYRVAVVIQYLYISHFFEILPIGCIYCPFLLRSHQSDSVGLHGCLPSSCTGTLLFSHVCTDKCNLSTEFSASSTSTIRSALALFQPSAKIVKSNTPKTKMLQAPQQVYVCRRLLRLEAEVFDFFE